MTEEERIKRAKEISEQLRKKRARCSLYCGTWNSEDRDCEIYGENHPSPSHCKHYIIRIIEEEIKARSEKMILKAVKKPIPIICVQWNGDNLAEVKEFCGKIDANDVLLPIAYLSYVNGEHLMIRTLEGDHSARIGDYIIKGVRGECYPCEKSIFEETYNVLE